MSHHRQNRYEGVAQERHKMCEAIAREGILAYVARLWRSGSQLPWPYSDRLRWEAMSEDTNPEQESIARTSRWLLDHESEGRRSLW